MPKEKYVNQNRQNAKSKILRITILLAIFLLLLIVVLALLENSRKQPKYSTEMALKQILENHGCTFIKMRNSTENNFDYDINVVFAHDLYEEEKSQEEFYQEIINEVAQCLQYKNFRLLDKQKEEPIEIKVICLKDKIQKIWINGREDYFIYMNSQKSLGKYTQIKNTDFIVQSSKLLECIQNNWNSNVNFGTREAIFQNYYIYFDEGIEVRKIGGKIYNIIFTKNYTESVVNGFTVGEKRDIIERELGVPTFKNENESIIGYKNENFYIFFEENQISIYRNIQETGFEEFFKLTNQFLNQEYSVLEFMNELTYVWPDYEEYQYDANRVFLSYPHKGIDIKINDDNVNGIVLYNNIGISSEEVKQYLKSTEFIARLQIDNIYNAEVRRVEKLKDFENRCNEYRQKFEIEDIRNRGEIYHYYAEFSNNKIASMYFISQNQAYPNCELKESIKSYIWGKEDYFIYSIEKKGIYYYDLKTQTKGTIMTGNDAFVIQSLENGILTYDNKTIPIND